VKQLPDVPGSAFTSAGSINNAGVITIIAPDTNAFYRSYLYRHGKFTEVKVPGAYETFVQGINNNGDLALVWNYTDMASHPALRFKGKFYKFNFKKNAIDTYVFGLNDHRAMVGSAFLLTKKGLAFKAFKAKY
jgi:hypothetical protein